VGGVTAKPTLIILSHKVCRPVPVYQHDKTIELDLSRPTRQFLEGYIGFQSDEYCRTGLNSWNIDITRAKKLGCGYRNFVRALWPRPLEVGWV